MNKKDTLSYPLAMKDTRITFFEQDILPSLNNNVLPSFFPHQLQIDLTRYCEKWFFYKANGNTPKDCQGCACPIKNKENIPFASLKRFIEIFEKHRGKSIYLTGGGEPGNYPNIREFLNLLADSQLELQVNTNGAIVAHLNEAINLEKIFSREKGQPIVNVSIHDNETYKTLHYLAELRSKKQLYMLIRSTYMIHDDTTIQEIEDFFTSSENAGADVAAVRPYYVFKNDKRIYVSNKIVLEAVNRFINEWSGQIKIQAPKIDRLGAEDTVKIKPTEPDTSLCFSPLIAMSFNADMAAGMCCDTKETGLGNTSPSLICHSIPENPREYYLKALCGIVTLNKSYCVYRCGFTEYNTLLKEKEGMSFLYTTLTELRKDYFSGKINVSAIDVILNSIFKGGQNEG